MGRFKKYIFPIILIVFVAGAGLIATNQDKDDSFIVDTAAQTPVIPLSPEELRQQQIDAAKQADYMTAPPHYGPLIQTEEITVTFDGDIATGVLPALTAEKVKKDQLVILYDKEGYTLPLGGRISEVTPIAPLSEEASKEADTNYTVSVTLPEGTNTELLLPQLDIITLETIASKRLPLSALREDESGAIYVWKAMSTDLNEKKHYTVSRQYIKVGLKDQLFFEEDGNKIDTFDLIVLNPDNNVRSDKTYGLYATKIDAPLHNPVKQAWIDFELNYLDEQQAEMAQITEDCLNGKKQPPPLAPGVASLPDGTYAGVPSSCPAGTNPSEGPTNPFTIFRSLTNTSNAGDTSGTACGSAPSGSAPSACSQ